jgi:hypothetical protein
MDLIYRKMDSLASASTDDDGDMYSVSPDIPGPNVMSLSMAVIYSCLQKFIAFVPVKCFQLSLMFVCKARSLPSAFKVLHLGRLQLYLQTLD